MTDNLYKTDFVEWAFNQAQALANHDIKSLDWDNLKEEIEDLGREQINAVRSFVKRLIEHRLKVDYCPDAYSRNHWLNEIDNFQDEIEKRLTKTILNKLDVDKEYRLARRLVLRRYDLEIPEVCPYTFDDLMEKLG